MTGLASLIIVAVYPLMKRVTSWPQAVLGLAFSWGALMGWAAYYGSLSWAALALYASAFSWTIGYDTIYAQQDARDDAIVGIRSTARLFGAQAKFGVGIFYALAALLAQAALLLAGPRSFAEIGWLGVRRAPRLAGLAHGRQQSRDGAKTVPLQSRCGAFAILGARAQRVDGFVAGRPSDQPGRDAAATAAGRVARLTTADASTLRISAAKPTLTSAAFSGRNGSRLTKVLCVSVT